MKSFMQFLPYICWGYEQAKLWASRNPAERAPDRMRTNDLFQWCNVQIGLTVENNSTKQ